MYVYAHMHIPLQILLEARQAHVIQTPSASKVKEKQVEKECISVHPENLIIVTFMLFIVCH